MSVIENSKVTVVGAGSVGSSVAYAALIRGSARHVALYDINTAKVDAEFLSDRGWKSNFLVNLGHGDPAAEKPRGPRFWFDETCLML